MCYRKHEFFALHTKWPKIQLPAGNCNGSKPWTKVKIKTGVYLMEQLAEAKKLVKRVAQKFIDQRNTSQHRKQKKRVHRIPTLTKPICPIIALLKYFKNDAQFLENLKKLVSIFQDIKNGDLFNIIEHYQLAFEGFLYIAKVLQMDPKPIQNLLVKIPEGLAEIQASNQEEDLNRDTELEEEGRLIHNCLDYFLNMNENAQVVNEYEFENAIDIVKALRTLSLSLKMDILRDLVGRI